jgi:hypothetical protein
MRTSIRIAVSGEPVNPGGLPGAFGVTIPGASSEIEIVADGIKRIGDLSGFVEENAVTAASAFLLATTGSLPGGEDGYAIADEAAPFQPGPRVGQVFDEIKAGELPLGAILLDRDGDPWKISSPVSVYETYAPYTLIYLPPVATETEA